MMSDERIHDPHDDMTVALYLYRDSSPGDLVDRTVDLKKIARNIVSEDPCMKA